MILKCGRSLTSKTRNSARANSPTMSGATASGCGHLPSITAAPTTASISTTSLKAPSSPPHLQRRLVIAVARWASRRPKWGTLDWLEP